MHKKITVSEILYPDWPIHALGASVTVGDPKGSGQAIFETPDKRVHCGVWGCSPGTLELTFEWDQVSYLLEGEIVIEQEGELPITVQPGDLLMCPKGTKSRWIVTKACKEIWFDRTSEPTI